MGVPGYLGRAYFSSRRPNGSWSVPGFPHITGLLPKLYLEGFFRNRVVSGRVELAGSYGEGMYRRAELAAHFPGMIWMVSGDPKELAGAKAAGWHTIQVHRRDGQADFTCSTLTDVWRLL